MSLMPYLQCWALDAHSECETGVFVRIYAAVLALRVNHTAPGLKPACMFANRNLRPYKACSYVHFSAWLSERENEGRKRTFTSVPYIFLQRNSVSVSSLQKRFHLVNPPPGEKQ
jgi:hypothetical protein